MAPLDREQQQILNAILSEGRRIKDPRVRRIYERAAVQTGLVESGLRNLSGGDADSAGWRQERASLYPNPTNVGAAARRFRREFQQHYDPGERSWDVAAQVQRPAAQYRGRYKDEAGEAAAILRQYAGGGGSAGGGSSAASDFSGQDAPAGQAALGDQPNGAAVLASLLAAQPRQAPSGSSLAPPSFAAKPVMGGAVPQGGQAPAARPDVAALIAAARTVGGDAFAPPAQSDAGAAVTPSALPGGGSGLVPLGGRRNAGKGEFVVTGPNPGRLQKPLTKFANRVASIYGGTLTGLDGSTHSKMTVNGNVSQHYTGNATDIFTIDGKPATGARLIRAGRAALIAAGMPRKKALKAPGGLYNVGGHQIIFGVNGTQYGGNHLDHLHISAR